MLLLRVFSAFRFRVDADEPQHLHVIWGWANGYFQYRDVFDNHGPVFHLLFAPLFHLLGERADILIPMRLAMLPFFAVILWCVYRIGTSLFSSRVGFWSAILTGFYPEFFLTTTEFRTDVLWTTLWFLALMIIARGRFQLKQALLTGLLLGTAFGVTVKTGLMVGALFPWWVLNAIAAWKDERPGSLRSLCVKTIVGVCGFAVVPCAALLFFATHGLEREFLYYNIGFNLVPHAQNWARFDGHVLWFPLFVLLLLGLYPFLRRQQFTEADTPRIGLVLTAGFYFTALKTFFPTLSRQDDLPVIPLAALIIVALTCALADRVNWRPRLRWLLQSGFPLLVLIEIVVIAAKTSFWQNDTAGPIAQIATVLQVTDKGDFVMDATGETIFRRRPFYYALEAFTRVRIERGLVKDDIDRCLIQTRTELVRMRELTKHAERFVRGNYVLIGNGLWMPGKPLKPASPARRKEINFETRIATRYAILDPQGKAVAGLIDGAPFTGASLLDAGPHQFIAEAEVADYLLLFSARGVERGILPSAVPKP